MASRSNRFFRALGYASAAGAVGAGGLYTIYRPREIPGSEAAAVPPPTYGEGGVFNPPNFPEIKSRAAQIADLKASAGADNQGSKGEEYDLLVIGAGATGTGIALDAATRGLKVAMVERDDFASGTSSKSTKLVHGGVRYLEKAVWELDYNQCVYIDPLVPLLSMLMTRKDTSSSRRLSVSAASSWIPLLISRHGSLL